MCAGCDSHYTIIENLESHINFMHGNAIIACYSLFFVQAFSKIFLIVVNLNPNATPLNLQVPKIKVEESLQPQKRRKRKETINNSIFQFKTQEEAQIATNLLDTFKVRSATLEIMTNESSVFVAVVSSQKDLNTLSSLYGTTVKFEVEASTVAQDSKDDVNFIGDEYMHHCLEGSCYSGLLKYGEYEEIDDSVLSVLNQDWKNKPFYRIACGQLLAGSIFVEGKEILLINCVELYNRKPTIDAHHERFSSSFMISSLPIVRNKYRKINATMKIEEKSRKLVIGTLVFNALVTSSIRLDQEGLQPEVGASTYSFTPSRSTKIYISRKSKAAANETIEEESQVDSQLRQLAFKSHLSKNLR